MSSDESKDLDEFMKVKMEECRGMQKKQKLYSKQFNFKTQLHPEDSIYFLNKDIIDKVINLTSTKEYLFPPCRFTYMHLRSDNNFLTTMECFARIKFEYYIRMYDSFNELCNEWIQKYAIEIKESPIYEERLIEYDMETYVYEPIGKYLIWKTLFERHVEQPIWDKEDEVFTFIGKLASLLWNPIARDDDIEKLQAVGKYYFNKFWPNPEITYINYHNYFGCVFLPIFYHKVEAIDFFLVREFFLLGTKHYTFKYNYTFCDEDYKPISICDLVDEYMYSVFSYFTK